MDWYFVMFRNGFKEVFMDWYFVMFRNAFKES